MECLRDAVVTASPGVGPSTYSSAERRFLQMMRILDRFRPYSKGLNTGWQVNQYNDRTIRKMSGTSFMLNLLCTISKLAPQVKLSSEAR